MRRLSSTVWGRRKTFAVYQIKSLIQDVDRFMYVVARVSRFFVIVQCLEGLAGVEGLLALSTGGERAEFDRVLRTCFNIAACR